MDRSWMNESRISPEYEEGVEQFLQFASERGQPDEDRKYYCPCINCLNGRQQILDDIREHLLCDGIKRNYTTWIWHGEMTDMQSGQQSELFDVEMGDRLEDMICDLGQESFQQAHAPMYDTLQTDSKKPLYSGCKNSLTLLSAVLNLVNIKARYGWSDKSFSSLLQVVHDMLPEENTLPKSYYQAKKILCPMGMEYQKIHACPNDCILYRHQLIQMATQPNSPPPPPPSTSVASHSSSPPLKRTRKASRLRSLATKLVGAERPLVHVDPVTGKADGPHSKKFRTYLVIVARDKVDVTYENWKHVPITQKDLIWEDIQAEFDIPEASDLRTKKKILQTVGKRWRQFKSDLTSKWALAADKDSVDDTVCKMYDISKEKWTQFCQSRRDPSWENVRKKAQAVQKQNTAPHVMSRGGYEYLEKKLMDEKRKKKLEEATQSGSTDTVIDLPSPIKRHVKWKLARTKKTGDMTSEAAKEIADKIDALEEQASQGSFVTHGRHDILTAAIGRPEHPGRVRAVGAGITIKQYFGSASRTSSIAPEYLQQLTQQIKDQLEDSIIEKVTQRLMLSLSQMQSQGLALPPEPDIGPSAARVSTKESCVDPSGNDPDTDDSYKCGLYIEEYPSRLVALGRVGVEEIRDADAPIPVPTKEVKVMGQALNTFLAWPTHLVKRLSEQGAVVPAKPTDGPDDEVDDPLYLMTLTIPQLFLKPLQVMWDATLFGLFNENFPLYIKHKDLPEIAHGGQCLSISVIQLWILHMAETSMRAGNIDVYGFLEPQSIQKSGQSQFESENYIKNWMQNSKRDVYLGAYLNGALKGLDDTQQSKSKSLARWIVVKYFTDLRPLEPEKLKALRNQWAKYYLKVKNET
ncbi:hypothetical protein HKD37_15G043257 [Glycine soja]